MRSFVFASLFFGLAACGGSETTVEPVNDDTSIASTVEEQAPKYPLPLPEETSADISGDDLAARIKRLADDRFEGRGPGTKAGEAAAFWIAAEMERIGLQPGADGSFLQPVGMVELTLDEETSGLFIASDDGPPRPTALGRDAVIWTKRQTTKPLSYENSDLVFVGYGVVAPEYDWNDYDGLDVEGKTVVMLINDPGFANPDGDLFNGAAMTYYGRWTYKLEEAGRQGAAGAIIIHETAPASYGWDVVESSWSGPQADLVRANAGRDRALLEGWMTADFANKLFAKAGLDFDEVKALAAKPGFTPVSLDGLNASARIEQSQRTLESHNVVGMIPGTTRPDEYVLYVAHWDHIGIKPSPDPDADTIYNGAVDNATGTAAILDIAEAMVDDELERSALFIAVTLEESGLLGSAHYAETPTVPLSNIVGGINVDALNPTGPSRDMIVVGYGSSELEELLAEQLAAQERVITPDPHPEAGYFYRSDHASFAKKGVPMLYANSGTDLLRGGTAAGEAFASLYAAERYHQPADEYDETWDMSGIEQNVIALYEFGRALAQSSSWPNWYEDNEFRAIRDASRSEE